MRAGQVHAVDQCRPAKPALKWAMFCRRERTFGSPAATSPKRPCGSDHRSTRMPWPPAPPRRRDLGTALSGRGAALSSQPIGACERTRCRRREAAARSAPKVCSFQLPEVCSFQLPLTLARGRIADGTPAYLHASAACGAAVCVLRCTRSREARGRALGRRCRAPSRTAPCAPRRRCRSGGRWPGWGSC